MKDADLIGNLCPNLRIYGNLLYNKEEKRAVCIDNVESVKVESRYIYINGHWLISDKLCEVEKLMEILEIYQNEKAGRNKDN